MLYFVSFNSNRSCDYKNFTLRKRNVQKLIEKKAFGVQISFTAAIEFVSKIVS